MGAAALTAALLGGCELARVVLPGPGGPARKGAALDTGDAPGDGAPSPAPTRWDVRGDAAGDALSAEGAALALPAGAEAWLLLADPATGALAAHGPPADGAADFSDGRIPAPAAPGLGAAFAALDPTHIAVGAPDAGEGGEVHLLRSLVDPPAERPLFAPDRAQARAGAALAAGDVDGDGLADLVVGAPASGDGAGRIYLLSDALGDPPEAGGDEPPSLRWSAEGGGFGAVVAILPDLDGDGLDEVGACGPGVDLSWDPGAGVCVIVHGASTREGLLDWDRVTAFFAGDDDDDALGGGTAPMHVADFNGDGAADLALAAPGSGAGGEVGIWFGPNPTGWRTLEGADVVLAEAGSGALLSLDHDGDGADDLLCGRPDRDDLALFTGLRAGAAPPSATFPSGLPGERHGHRLLWGPPGPEGPEGPTLVVGAPAADAGGEGAGRYRVFQPWR